MRQCEVEGGIGQRNHLVRKLPVRCNPISRGGAPRRWFRPTHCRNGTKSSCFSLSCKSQDHRAVLQFQGKDLPERLGSRIEDFELGAGLCSERSA